ncbi:hypothetical protein BDP55DRAFT_124314 [Colletotrichum godetiae]|uniref:Uncharacterized protein n=1 Tax=Colletotrichum godetiae TaxID=1209918 RepID=A0AAJ0B0M8_9PEZI|nr:uncharacterized protein BDP55DRAFT_124314 [Colletotrichum godetiae]KAK1700268.1 hypothetical protein BDP55DRAFT_124314 [Colletotrichum godetiae]
MSRTSGLSMSQPVDYWLTPGSELPAGTFPILFPPGQVRATTCALTSAALDVGGARSSLRRSGIGEKVEVLFFWPWSWRKGKGSKRTLEFDPLFRRCCNAPEQGFGLISGCFSGIRTDICVWWIWWWADEIMGRIRGPRRADSQDWILGYGKHLTRALAEYGGFGCLLGIQAVAKANRYHVRCWLLLPRKRICGRRLRIPGVVGKAASTARCTSQCACRQTRVVNRVNPWGAAPKCVCGASRVQSRRKCQTGRARLAFGV